MYSRYNSSEACFILLKEKKKRLQLCAYFVPAVFCRGCISRIKLCGSNSITAERSRWKGEVFPGLCLYFSLYCIYWNFYFILSWLFNAYTKMVLIVFQDVFPLDFGSTYDNALQMLMLDFLSKLERLIPIPDLQQVKRLKTQEKHH